MQHERARCTIRPRTIGRYNSGAQRATCGTQPANSQGKARALAAGALCAAFLPHPLSVNEKRLTLSIIVGAAPKPERLSMA
jgi:hypothetical protein